MKASEKLLDYRGQALWRQWSRHHDGVSCLLRPNQNRPGRSLLGAPNLPPIGSCGQIRHSQLAIFRKLADSKIIDESFAL
jgi:hypothetical protein